MDAAGVFPVLPALGSSTRSAETIVGRVLVEDEILASWLDVLIADGLVPPRASLGNPY
ncbi:hypothetical protein [Cryptosporangium arvum]|uniref:Uncharacterized protein n=1 Tax=Cryptosporangium arvum DSM 44712 TaxID=927661 RepID=A0A011ADM4_9ACTN|nr:hypothetical protein [Cryptosporangium arvum]EXG80156.1 hypothetical protein CryarDRAFT_1222 [Cryptosporangium arvum DSM 44712]